MSSTNTQEKTQSRKDRLRWWTLAVVSVTVLLATIDETILNVAIPSLQRDLGATASSLQWDPQLVLACLRWLAFDDGRCR